VLSAQYQRTLPMLSCLLPTASCRLPSVFNLAPHEFTSLRLVDARRQLKTDVIIVGAGPSGLALACQLTRYQVDFVIIDKREGLTPYSKALGVHARTLEITNNLTWQQRPSSKHDCRQSAPARTDRVLGQVELSNIGRGLSAYPFMLVLEQSRNEQLMYDWLKSYDREVLWQTELENFSQKGGGGHSSCQKRERRCISNNRRKISGGL